MKVVNLPYNVKKFLMLLAVYATSIIITSVAVGDLAQGFGLATAGWLLLYAAMVKLSKW